jgi:hypothetical protein
MKTLRLLRNIAALFIFGAALVGVEPGAALSNTFMQTCASAKCVSGKPCNNSACSAPGANGYYCNPYTGYNCTIHYEGPQ